MADNERLGVDAGALREEIARFVREQLPSDIAAKAETGAPLLKAEFVRWQKLLHARGWAAPAWPVTWGGTGWTLEQLFVFEETCAALGAPRLPQFGLGMLGPILIRYGTDAQKQRYLPSILSADEWWCQGYSEPGAGSDLAMLRTSAVRDDDVYIVNGSKMWTTYAHYADRMFALVRTDTGGSKQDGISFLLLDMRDPGVTIRPVIGLDGQHVVNEVFFDSVRVPITERVGAEGEGWTIAKALLTHERTGNARVGFCKKQLQRLKGLAARVSESGRLIDDPIFGCKIAEIEIDIMVLEGMNLRTLAAAARGTHSAAQISVLKVVASEVQQRLTELLLEAAGPYGSVLLSSSVDLGEIGFVPPECAYISSFYLDWRKASIYAGSNEIQRNIIAKHAMLGAIG